MMSLPIQIVDDQDKPIRAGTKQEAWEQGLYHRVVRIMIDDSHGNVVLQKRSERMPTYPGCWDNSAAGHVDAGEDYLTAAKRELHEELGLTGYQLNQVKRYETHGEFEGKKLNRFVMLYTLTLPVTTDFHLQETEVAKVKWVSKDELKALVHSAEAISDGLTEVYSILYS